MTAYSFTSDTRDRLFLADNVALPVYTVTAGVGFAASPSAKSVYEPVIQQNLSSISQTSFVFTETKPNILLYKSFVKEDSYTAPSVGSLTKSLSSSGGSIGNQNNFEGGSSTLVTNAGVKSSADIQTLLGANFATSNLRLFDGNRPNNSFNTPSSDSAASFTLNIPDLQVNYIDNEKFMADQINTVLGYIDEIFTILNKIGDGIENGFKKLLDMFETVRDAILDTISSWLGNFSNLQGLFFDNLSALLIKVAEQIVAAMNELMGSNDFLGKLADGIFAATTSNVNKLVDFVAQLTTSGSFSFEVT